MKKKSLAAFLALVTCLYLFPASTFAAGNFEDVPADAGYFEDVLYVNERGLMDSISPTLFSPDTALTRGASVNALYRLAGSPDTSTLANPFSDVTDEGLYANAVKWAASNQIISGFNDKFWTEDNITRQDFAVMAARCLNLLNPGIALTQQYIIFTDEADIADYAKNAAQDIIKLEIITNAENDSFNPKGNITRAEAAAMFRRFAEIAAPN